VSDRIIFQHNNPSRFTVFALGQPGEREFFITCVSENLSTTIAVEKMQAIALSERFQELIVQLRRSRLVSASDLLSPAVVDNGEIDFPVTEDFSAGIIGLAWDEESARVQVEIQGFGDGSFSELLNDLNALTLEDPPELFRAYLSIPQIRGFIIRCEKLAASGRKPCIFCGLPIDSNGHLCPRANGYKR
jgi:uncharacterized repeat protein (TIGR03847 family)